MYPDFSVTYVSGYSLPMSPTVHSTFNVLIALLIEKRSLPISKMLLIVCRLMIIITLTLTA